MEWLATWEPIEAPGLHAKQHPAGFAHGYQFGLFQMDKRPRTPEILPEMSERVLRAIPVEGEVGDKASWENCPQARFWLEKPKPNLGERLRAWLRRPVA